MIKVALGLDVRDLKRGQKEFNGTFREMAVTANAETASMRSGIGRLKSGLEAAGVEGQKLGKLGALAGNLGPLAVAGAAIGAVWKGAVALVDLYKKKQEEATDLANKHFAAVQANNARGGEFAAGGKTDLTSLMTMSVKEGPLSNVELNAAEDAVARLREKYGELGIEVDKTNKIIKISPEAIRKVAESNQAMAIRAKKDEYDALVKQYTTLEGQAKARFTSSADAEEYRKQAAALVPQMEAARQAWQRAGADNDPEKFTSKFWRDYRAERNDRDDAEAEKAAADELARQNKEREEAAKAQERYGQSLKGSLQTMREQMLVQTGMGRQAERERAVREMESAKGRALTDSEKRRAMELGSMRYDLSQLGASRQQLDTSIRSNELSELGGAYNLVVTPDADSITAGIAQDTAAMREMLDKIQQRLNKLGIVGG